MAFPKLYPCTVSACPKKTLSPSRLRDLRGLLGANLLQSDHVGVDAPENVGDPIAAEVSIQPLARPNVVGHHPQLRRLNRCRARSRPLPICAARRG